MITRLNELIDIAKTKKTRRLAVAAAADKPVLEAVRDAVKEGIVEPILVGNKSEIEKIASEVSFDLTGIEIIDNQAGTTKSAQIAVSLVREGKADILMKGLVSTGALLKVVLDKENGLRKGATLSHIAFFESPYYHKLLGVTDVAMNVAPEIQDKINIVNNAVEAFHKLGILLPKVAVLAAIETVNPKMESTVHAAMLKTMSDRKQFTGCIIDGPLALDNAISKEAAEHKGIESVVSGDCDILLCPDIVSGNFIYKCLNFLGGATSAAVIMGAAAPIVLTSRSDTDRSKMLSIALAAAME